MSGNRSLSTNVITHILDVVKYLTLDNCKSQSSLEDVGRGK